MKKEFDCVEMKHTIQSEIYEETKNLTHEEELEYFHQSLNMFIKNGEYKAEKNPLSK